jgi:hypothetical protein
MKKTYSFLLISLIGNLCFAQVSLRTLTCKTYGTPDGSQTQYNEIGYSLDNLPVVYGGCTTAPAIIVAVIDSTCNSMSTCENDFGQLNQFTIQSGTCGDPNLSGTGNCRNRPEKYFIFQFSNAAHMNSLQAMLSNVPNGSYILAYTWYVFPYSTVSAFATSFQSIGAVSINTLPDDVPYIFFIRKGDVSSLVEIIGTSPTDSLMFSANIACKTTSVFELGKNDFSVFPNPVADYLQIKNLNDGQYDWKIQNINGQKVSSGSLSSGNSIVATDGLTPGMYFIQLKDQDKTLNSYFIKK